MKKIFIFIAIISLLAAPCFAEPAYDEAYCKQLFEQAPEQLQRGCCSWHGGVCGCQNGMTVCCDGTYSPSRRCN